MGIINQKTGYYGFTTDGMGGSPIDVNGNVTRVLFSIQYPNRVNDVEFTMSNGPEDWAVQMGDGSLIPINNPVVLFQNKDNSIVQFDMSQSYPSNSPCVLTYRSDSAWFNIKEISGNRPWAPNTISGHFGFTVEGYGGTPSGNGCVDRIVCAIPFPVQATDVEFTLSTDPSHWGARVGDGSIINLRDPVVLFSNRDSGIVQFTMDTPYPSNSPCVMIYRSSDAWFNVKVVTGDGKFVPVTNIRSVPSVVAAGIPVDLSATTVEPSNASKQGITWSIVSGKATVQGDSLLATDQGSFVLKANIEGGGAEEADYTQTFNINATKNTITIAGQPDPFVNITVGEINAMIAVTAKSDSGDLHYKWYRNSVNNVTGASAISGAISSAYQIPTALTKGDYFYFCEITSPGAETVNSSFCKVHVAPRLTGIEIIPRTVTLALQQERQLSIRLTPVDADIPHVIWSSSNTQLVQITTDGKIFAMASGTVTITVKNDSGSLTDTLAITVSEFKPVKDITGIITTAVTNKAYTLAGTVIPVDATNKSITWSLINAGTTEATLINGVFTPKKVGSAIIRATIAKGFTTSIDFTKDVVIEVTKSFVPVTDITLKDIPSEIHVGDSVYLDCTIIPMDSTNTVATFSIASPGTTGASLTGDTLTFKNEGTVLIRATVTNGTSITSDYQKDFSLSILPAWISVTDIKLTPSDYDPSAAIGVPSELKTTVSPANATKQDIVMKMIDASTAHAVFNASNKTLLIDPKQMTPGETSSVIMELTIIDGISKGFNYVVNRSIRVVPVPPPEVFIPVTDVQLSLPNPVRAWYPILLKETIVSPWNSTSRAIQWTASRGREYLGADINLFSYDPEDPFTHKGKNPFFNWELEGLYLFGYDPGLCKLQLLITKGSGQFVGEDFEKELTVEFQPPYIPVKDVENVPLKIPCRTNVVFTGEVNTRGGTGYHNPTWDEEIPSYGNLIWRLDRGHISSEDYLNESETVVKPGNVIYAAKPGRFTIQANVQNGTNEPISWYWTEDNPDDGRRQSGESFNKLFTIEVVAEELPYEYPLMTLILQGGKKVEVFRFCDIYNCCSDQPATSTITIGEETFRKDQVIEVKFWENQYKPGEPEIDDTIPVTQIDGIADKFTSGLTLDGVRKYYYNLDKNIIVHPNNSTNTKITWTCVMSPGATNAVTIQDGADVVLGQVVDGPNMGDDVTAGLAGEHIVIVDPAEGNGYILATATIKDGISKGSDYVETFLISFGNVDPEQTLGGIEIVPIHSSAIYGTVGSTVNLKANLFGSKAEWLTSHYDSIVWELVGTYTTGTKITRTKLPSFGEDMKQEAKLLIGKSEPVDTTITIKASLKYSEEDEKVNPEYIAGTLAFEAESYITIVPGPEDVLLPPPPLKNLRNFGRNFTKLTKLDRIPNTVTGNDCLRNFLWGCTSFNQELLIPNDVTGKRCLKHFLRECTSFNSVITIPRTVTGEECMFGFLYGCSSFNTSITIPGHITGPGCLERFLIYCEKFNQPLRIPEGVSGAACLRNFLTEAHSFNRPLTIPDSISGEANMAMMLRDCNAMISPITMSEAAAIGAVPNGQTFTSVFRESKMISLGLPIIGPGAEIFKTKLANYMFGPPYRNMV